jgi:hypothetical protein
MQEGLVDMEEGLLRGGGAQPGQLLELGRPFDGPEDRQALRESLSGRQERLLRAWGQYDGISAVEGARIQRGVFS